MKELQEIAAELKKLNQIIAVIGNGLLKKDLEKIQEKKRKIRKIDEGRRGVS